jgi:hypothetical protein
MEKMTKITTCWILKYEKKLYWKTFNASYNEIIIFKLKF